LWDKMFCMIFLAGIIESNYMDTAGDGSQDVSQSPYRDCTAITRTQQVMCLKMSHSLPTETVKQSQGHSRWWVSRCLTVFLQRLNNPMDIAGDGSQDVPQSVCSCILSSPHLIWQSAQSTFHYKLCVNRMTRWMGVGNQACILDWDVSDFTELWTGLVHGSSFYSAICIS
jgi:hypothetical protein